MSDRVLRHTIDLGETYGHITYAIHYVCTLTGVAELLRWLASMEQIGLDIETDGSTPDGLNWRSCKIATIQIGNVTGADPRVFVLCVRSLERLGVDWTPLWQAVCEKQLFGQNIGFECVWLQYRFGVEFTRVVDTQIIEQTIRAGLFGKEKDQRTSDSQDRSAYKHCSMEALCRRYLGLQIDKGPDVRLTFWTTPAGRLSDHHLIYAAGDVVYPFYVAFQQRQDIKERRLQKVVGWELDLIPTIADSKIHGIRLDTEQWLSLYQEAKVKRREAQDALDEIFRPDSEQEDLFGRENTRPTLGKTEVNYSSATQVKQILRVYCDRVKWGIQLIITEAELRKAKQTWGREWAARQDGRVPEDAPDSVLPWSVYCVLISVESPVLQLAKLRGQLPPHVVDALLEYRDYDKKCSTYGAEFLRQHVVMDDHRFGTIHTEWHQAITSTGRLSSSPNCYDGATEILTPTGWVRFDQLEDGVPVAQVTPRQRAISFVVPESVTRMDYDGPMLSFESANLGLCVTPNHRMYVESRHKYPEIHEASRWPADRKHLHAGTYVGGEADISPGMARLLVALHAKGRRQPNGEVRFDVNGARNSQRLTWVLQQTGVAQRRYETTGWRGVVYGRIVDRCMSLLGDPITFGSWILTLSRPALDAFLSELMFWKSSRSEVDATWEAIAHALSNRHARQYFSRAHEKWVVKHEAEPHSWTTNVVPREVPSDGRVYCVTVPTGLVLVRRKQANGQYCISVSGNTQNIPRDPRYRKCFVPRPGNKFLIFDYASIEPRITAEVSQDPVYLETFRDKAKDIYAEVWRAMTGQVINKKERAGKILRQGSKSVVLGKAYRMGPGKLCDDLTLKLAEYIQSGEVPLPTVEYARELDRLYLEKHKGIAAYQERAGSQADPQNREAPRVWDRFLEEPVTFVTAPCGRTRFFPPDSKNWYTESVNVAAQAGSASITKLAAILVRKAARDRGIECHIVNYVHDELVIEVPDEHAEAFAPVAQECMEEAGRRFLKTVPVFAEPAVGNGVCEYWFKES